MTEPLLEIRSLSVRYGQQLALDQVDVAVMPGETVAVLGRNGAGKTSFALAIAGLVASSGSVRFRGSEIAGQRPFRVARQGVTLVPEGRGVLQGLTVRENLAIGEASGRKAGGASGPTRSDMIDRFPRLGERLDQQAERLSGGEQQILVLARAILARPKLLILDEPSLGLAPLVINETVEVLQELSRSGLSVLLIEQNIGVTRRLADRAYVFANGRVVTEGTTDSVCADEQLLTSYLGASVPAMSSALGQKAPTTIQ